jgi:hypothetical protein
MQNQPSLERCSCLHEAFSAFGPLRLALSGKLLPCVTRKSDTVRQAGRDARPCYGIDSAPGRCRVPTETTTGLARAFLEDLVRRIFFGNAMVPSTLLRNGVGNGSIDTEVLGAQPRICLIAASTGSDFRSIEREIDSWRSGYESYRSIAASLNWGITGRNLTGIQWLAT